MTATCPKCGGAVTIPGPGPGDQGSPRAAPASFTAARPKERSAAESDLAAESRRSAQDARDDARPRRDDARRESERGDDQRGERRRDDPFRRARKGNKGLIIGLCI